MRHDCCRDPDQDRCCQQTVYLRIERKYKYELRKIVFPLFIIVLMSMASFGLEPDKTDARIAAPTGMMLATIGFQYVILETMPKNPSPTRLDWYVTTCMLLIILVVAETLFVKQYLEGGRLSGATVSEDNVTMEVLGESTAVIQRNSREYVAMEWVDWGFAWGSFALWFLPHCLLFGLPRNWVAFVFQSTWGEVLEFIDKKCEEIKRVSGDDTDQANTEGSDDAIESSDANVECVNGVLGGEAVRKSKYLHRSKKTIKTSNKVAPLDEEEQAEIAASVARPRRNLSRSSTFSLADSSSNSSRSLASLAEP